MTSPTSPTADPPQPKTPCTWPDCLPADAQEKLLIACDYAVRGEQEPDPDLTDYKTIHNCYVPEGLS